MDTESKSGNYENENINERISTKGTASARTSAVVVFIMALAVLAVLSAVAGHPPWPLSKDAPIGAGRFGWVIIGIIILFLSYLGAYSSYKSTLKAEAKRGRKKESKGDRK
jgi:hypothetical protein